MNTTKRRREKAEDQVEEKQAGRQPKGEKITKSRKNRKQDSQHRFKYVERQYSEAYK